MFSGQEKTHFPSKIKSHFLHFLASSEASYPAGHSVTHSQSYQYLPGLQDKQDLLEEPLHVRQVGSQSMQEFTVVKVPGGQFR